MEWLSLASFQDACSGVRPSIAIFTGTNHASSLWVSFSCSKRTDLSVGATGLFCAMAKEALNQRDTKARRRGINEIGRITEISFRDFAATPTEERRLSCSRLAMSRRSYWLQH